MDTSNFTVKVVDDREHRKIRPAVLENIPALERGAIIAMGVAFQVETGYRQSITIARDIVFDQDSDGSWSLNVYQAGHESGGGIRFGDEALHELFREVMTLVLDPDRYGDRDAVLVEKPCPPIMQNTDAAQEEQR